MEDDRLWSSDSRLRPPRTVIGRRRVVGGRGGGGDDKKEGSTPTCADGSPPSVSSRRPKWIFFGQNEIAPTWNLWPSQFIDLVSPRSPPWKRVRLPPCSGDGSRFITPMTARVGLGQQLVCFGSGSFFSSSSSRRRRAARCGALAKLSVWFASSARRSAGNVNAIIKITK